MKERKGYVFESNGKWFARITLTDNTGKRRNIKHTAQSKSDAKDLLKRIIRQLDDEGAKIIDSWTMTFNDLADYYEANYAKSAVFVNNQKVEGLRALERVKIALVYFREWFGRQRLREISHGDILAYRSNRLQTPIQYKAQTRYRTVATVNRELSCLRRIFNISVQQGWIIKNPFKCGDALIMTSCERRRERILTLDEEIRLLEACNHPQRLHLKSLLIALLDTGCRKGEMLSLVWRDVDMQNRIITIQARNTKTLRTRQVAITQRFFDALITLWEKSDKLLDSTVFGISDNVRNSFKTACKIAGIQHGGIDGLTLHCLRHTAATRLVNGQLPIQMVGRILGHSQPQTTYRYLTATQDTARQAASILESYQTSTTANTDDSVTDYIN
jgi:integrase